MKFDVDVVLEKADLVQFVKMAGGNPENDNPHRYSSHCPLHGGKNNTAFSIYYENGKWKWHCFTDSCGSGDAISFVMKWQQIDFKLACEFILGEKIIDYEALKVSAEQRLEEARLEEIAAKERKEARLHELQRTERHLQYHKARAGYQWAINMWNEAGIDEGLQDFFYLGAVEDYTYQEKKQEYHSPTLAIPYFNEDNQVVNIQHRLVNPRNPKSKYRFSSGLGNPDFLAIPLMGYDGDLIIVVEGGKKSMVTWSKCPTETQVIGVPALNQFTRLIEPLKGKGKKTIIIRDPRANESDEDAMNPVRLARAVGARIITPPVKIDDYINSTKIAPNNFYSFLKQARKV